MNSPSHDTRATNTARPESVRKEPSRLSNCAGHGASGTTLNTCIQDKNSMTTEIGTDNGNLIGFSEIKEKYLPHRYPILMLDRITDYRAGEFIEARAGRPIRHSGRGVDCFHRLCGRDERDRDCHGHDSLRGVRRRDLRRCRHTGPDEMPRPFRPQHPDPNVHPTFRGGTRWYPLRRRSGHARAGVREPAGRKKAAGDLLGIGVLLRRPPYHGAGSGRRRGDPCAPGGAPGCPTKSGQH